MIDDMPTAWEPTNVVRLPAGKVGDVLDEDMRGAKGVEILRGFLRTEVNPEDEIYLGLESTEFNPEEQTTRLIVVSKTGREGTWKSLATTGPDEPSANDREYTRLYLLMMADGVPA